MTVTRIATFGKCIVAGEHAVLRGNPALVFPFRGKRFVLEYHPHDSPLKLEAMGEFGPEAQLVFHSVLDRALAKLGKKEQQLGGVLRIDNTIPVGGGLGASAALCVAVGNLFESLGWLQKSDRYSFARELEDMFHGESSGVDIAIALHERPLVFVRGEQPEIFDAAWTPNWFLSYSGQRGLTADCIRRVKSMIEADPVRGKTIDLEMRRATEEAVRALRTKNSDSEMQLAHAIQRGRSCFEQWGLADGALQEQMIALVRYGAYAVKPTGSGGGGHILSLWNSDRHAQWTGSLLMPVGG